MDINAPIKDSIIGKLRVGDMLAVSGHIYCGWDAALPKLAALSDEERLAMGIDLAGGIIFHTAVSPAGVGPTSSNKEEIENSFAPLCELGVKLFLGKGTLKRNTVEALDRYNAIFAIVPPVTSLLGEKTLEREIVAFPEEGMEALYRLKVTAYPAIVAAAHDKIISV